MIISGRVVCNARLLASRKPTPSTARTDPALQRQLVRRRACRCLRLLLSVRRKKRNCMPQMFVCLCRARADGARYHAALRDGVEELRDQPQAFYLDIDRRGQLDHGRDVERRRRFGQLSDRILGRAGNVLGTAGATASDRII